MIPLQVPLETAIAAAREAGAILAADFHRAGGPRGHGPDKADADLEAERVIRARLQAACPDFGYLGEETGGAAGAPGAPVWLVDPNDGTRDYLIGRRGSAVSIGLAHAGLPVLGVVFAFAYPDDAGSLYAWAEGCGPLTRDGVPVLAAMPDELGPLDVVLVSSGGDRRPEGNLAALRPARFRAVVSIAHRLALLAAGEAAAAVSLFAPGAWDYAGGHALLRGAGGVLLDQHGQTVRYEADGSSRCERAFAGSAEVAAELRRRDWRGALEGSVAAFQPAMLEPGRTVRDVGRLTRAQGALLGQLAGDSLGSLVEFLGATAIAAEWGEGPRDLQDGGTWHTLAGQPTDDSEMALTLARSIVAAGGYDPVATFSAYRAWGASGPFDIGGTTRAALSGHPRPDSQANGSLMRIAPLALFAHEQPAEAAADLARTDSALTHPHPVCGDACAAFVVAIGHALRHGDGGRAAWAAAVAWARRAGAEKPVLDALLAAAEGPRAADAATQGFVLIALQNAFYEALHAGSVEEGVVRSVRRGGDTDTNAAIAGALLGAIHGRAAVPARWARLVLSCRPTSAARNPRPAKYWPIDALVLAERLLLAGAGGAK